MCIRDSDLAGTSRRFPLVAAALTIALLSLAGMPPLAGFMSKWQILAAGLDVHSGLVDALVVFAALNSVLSLAYYLPVINAMYKPAAVEFTGATVSLPLALRAPMAFLAVFVVVVGVWPAVLTALTEPASAQLAALFGG